MSECTQTQREDEPSEFALGQCAEAAAKLDSEATELAVLTKCPSINVPVLSNTTMVAFLALCNEAFVSGAH